MAKGPQGAIPVAPSLCSFAGPSWRFRLGPQEMNLSAATLLSQSVETLPPPIPTCHSHDCKLADPRKLPGPSTSQRWDCLPSNQARIRGIEHPQLLSLQPSLRPTAHEYRSFLCLLKTADPEMGITLRHVRKPMSTFKANAFLLKNLLDSIENGDIQLPDFQRGWVWDDARIKDLLLSISRGFPIGAVMTLDASGDVQFVSKLIEGVAEDGKAGPGHYLLDGQQRLSPNPPRDGLGDSP